MRKHSTLASSKNTWIDVQYVHCVVSRQCRAGIQGSFCQMTIGGLAMAITQAYNGGLGAEPLVRFTDRTRRHRVRGQSLQVSYKEGEANLPHCRYFHKRRLHECGIRLKMAPQENLIELCAEVWTLTVWGSVANSAGHTAGITGG